MARFQNVFGLASGPHGRFHGPFRALTRVAVVSILWLVVFAATRVTPEPAAPLAALQDSDPAPQPDAFPQLSLDTTDDFSLFPALPFIGEAMPADAIGQAFVPLQERDDYQVAAPDILSVEVTSDEPADGSRLEEFSGERLVSPDGTIKLADHMEPICVAGKTLAEIKATIENCLTTEYRGATATVSVFAQNSHVYYVIVERGDSTGDTVARFPATGNETVVDVVTQINGLSELSNKRIWIARPSQAGDTILPVNWQQISEEGASADNQPILAGDRIFITDVSEVHLLQQWLLGILRPLLNNDASEPRLLPPAEETNHFPFPESSGAEEPSTDD